MTAYEMADLAQSNFSNSIAAMALYLTLVFAYLAAAYFVGKDLTRSQVTTLNAVFLTFALINTFGITAYTNAAVKIAIQSGITFDLGLFAPKPWVAQAIGVFCLLGIMICLNFCGTYGARSNSALVERLLLAVSSRSPGDRLNDWY